MEYKGKASLYMIEMVFRVRYVLEELGIDVPWNDDGPICELDVPHNGSSVKIRCEFSAEAARLLVKTILCEPIPAHKVEIIRARFVDTGPTDRVRNLVTDTEFLACSEVMEVLREEVTPVFIGQLLDRSTKHLLALAESVGVLPAPPPA